MKFVIFILTIVAWPACADTVFANRTIRPETILVAADLVTRKGTTPGTVTRSDAAIGMEARVALFAGRPIRLDDIGPPALIDRNQIVTLRFARNGLAISTAGRALMRGGMGDIVRIMNLSSRATVWGQVQQDGAVLVHN